MIESIVGSNFHDGGIAIVSEATGIEKESSFIVTIGRGDEIIVPMYIRLITANNLH